MIEGREGLPLGAKAAKRLPGHHPAPDQLDRDVLFVLIIRAGGQVHRAHPPGGDEPDQLVSADALADQGGRRLVLEELGEGFHGRRIKKGGGLLAGVEDRFDLRPQLGIAVTRLGQERLALVAAQVTRGLEELSDSGPSLRAQRTDPFVTSR